MYEDQTDPFLAQVPLTVSPFVSLPTATTLPYTYKTLPSTLPPSSTGNDPTTSTTSRNDPGSSKPKFILSSSGGQAAHPDDIIKSCQALQQHLQKMQGDAKTKIEEWEREIRERDLAEKRRLAPGYLDSQSKILQPEKRLSTATMSPEVERSLLDAPVPEADSAEGVHSTVRRDDEHDAAGEALDRAFGGMAVNG